MSPLDTPKNINGADFAADRAWVLLRMGEAVAARAVVNDVDAENYTTELYQVAMQTALASADPAAICGVADEGARTAAAAAPVVPAHLELRLAFRLLDQPLLRHLTLSLGSGLGSDRYAAV